MPRPISAPKFRRTMEASKNGSSTTEPRDSSENGTAAVSANSTATSASASTSVNVAAAASSLSYALPHHTSTAASSSSTEELASRLVHMTTNPSTTNNDEEQARALLNYAPASEKFREAAQRSAESRNLLQQAQQQQHPFSGGIHPHVNSTQVDLSMPPPRPMVAGTSMTTAASDISATSSSYKGKRRGRPPKSAGGGGSTKKEKKSTRRRSRSSEAAARVDPSSLPARLPKRSQMTISTDEDPFRLTNPLLELPSVIDANGNAMSTPPQAAELLLHAKLSYCLPDTFPLSYYARLLGFDVPPLELANDSNAHVPMDPSTVPLQSRDKDAAFQIPPLGTWYQQQQGEPKLDYVDPVYTALYQTGPTFDWLQARTCDPATNDNGKRGRRGRPKSAETSSSSTVNGSWSTECINMAREKGFLDEDYTVDMTQTPRNNSATFAMTLPHARVEYRFVWFPLPDEESTRQQIDSQYGVPSAAQYIKKQQSELVLFVESVSVSGENEESRKHAILLLSLVLERARAHEVWYGWIVGLPRTLEGICTDNFRMVPRSTGVDGEVTFLCDLQKCNYRYAFLYQPKSGVGRKEAPTERYLVRLPNIQDARSALEGNQLFEAAAAAARRNRPCLLYTGASTERMRSIAFGVQLDTASSTLQLLNGDGGVQDPIMSVPTFARQPEMDILRSFPAPSPTSHSSKHADDEIARELKLKQQELATAEGALEPKLRGMLQQLVDIRMEYEQGAVKRREERQILDDYQAVLDRRKEVDMAWQKQLEQDMDAVCDICNDGEVTPDNQILFCEACNVAVHQFCYGIERIPDGDYYCIACRYFKREKMGETTDRRGGTVAPSALPICCELCPRKQGAFIRTEMFPRERRKDRSKEEEAAAEPVSRWIHMTCAKWYGLEIVKPETIEDPTQLKDYFLREDAQCVLCLGRRGAYHKCRVEDCPNLMHVTCARSTGLCEVIHGENCHGEVETDPWTLLCPEHSEVDPGTLDKDKRVPIDQLVRAAREFPQEAKPPPPPEKPDKLFIKMTGDERKKFLADREFESAVVDEVLKNRLHGVHCEVCHQCEEDGKNLIKCSTCRAVVCSSCKVPADDDGQGRDFQCAACRYVDDKKKDGEEYVQPSCALCFQPGGCLRPGHASPVTNKYFKRTGADFDRTYFAKPFWCHTLCTLWHSTKLCIGEDGTVDCTNVVMTNGIEFLRPQVRCALCGHKLGLKLDCHGPDCRAWGELKDPFRFHPTCARQAGMEVADCRVPSGFLFYVKCLHHAGNAYNLRARLEDLLEIEKKRAGKRLDKAGNTMSLAHASRLMNKAILIMQQLGWAWRWAEWWIEYGDTWEPLLEPGEKEENMTKEQLRIVDTSRELRCEDARKCRLTALSAALRNRMYDGEEGNEDDEKDTVVLSRALRSMLHAKTLVGPLEQQEIDFFVEWLARAYRSKSRLLGFGPDKITVKEGAPGMKHASDGSPKYLLGSRRLPGSRELPDGEVFETDVDEVDDFLRPETLPDGTPVTEELLEKHGRKKRKGPGPPKSGKKRRKNNNDGPSKLSEEETPVPGKKKLGRPRKSASATAEEEPSPASGKKKLGRPRKSLVDDKTPPSSKGGGRKRKNQSGSTDDHFDEDIQTTPRERVVSTSSSRRGPNKKTPSTGKRQKKSSEAPIKAKVVAMEPILRLPQEQLYPLVVSDDKELISDELYTVFEQMEPSRVTEADKQGASSKAKKKNVGDSAITCKHCVGDANAFRYFPSSETALARSYCLEKMVHHLLDCSRCPSEVKDRIRPIENEKFSSHDKQAKKFFQRCWERIEQVNDKGGGPTAEDRVDVEDFAEDEQVAETGAAADTGEAAEPESAAVASVDVAQMEPPPRLAEEEIFPLVVPKDKELIPDDLYVVLEQIEPANVTEFDKAHNKNKVRGKNVGFHGVACKHCVGNFDALRSFPGNEGSVCQQYFPRSIIQHLLSCQHCPVNIQETARSVNSSKLTMTGPTKVFFQRLWRRIQRIPEDDVGEEVTAVAAVDAPAQSEEVTTAPPVGAPEPEIPIDPNGFTSIAERAKRRTEKRHEQVESDDDSKPLASLKKTKGDSKTDTSSPPMKLSATYTSEDEKPLSALKQHKEKEDDGDDEEESDNGSSEEEEDDDPDDETYAASTVF